MLSPQVETLFPICLPVDCILSIMSGQGVFGVQLHAKNTPLSRFIGIILLKVQAKAGDQESVHPAHGFILPEVVGFM